MVKVFRVGAYGFEDIGCMYVCPTKVLKRDTTELMKALKRVPTEFTVFEDQGLRMCFSILC